MDSRARWDFLEWEGSCFSQARAASFTRGSRRLWSVGNGQIPSVGLCGVLGQLGQTLAMTPWRGDDFHLLPIVGEFFAAIEASNVGSRQSSGLGATRGSTNG